uniref:Uncharacterized protein n=1 Tax=Geospiza parvula TaxID=87175 RepID=A0A8C3N8C9_GEOPR
MFSLMALIIKASLVLWEILRAAECSGIAEQVPDFRAPCPQGNAIRTAKYNLLTFLPLNLYEQFHRMANVYFVFVILLQTFPEISTLPWYTLLFPLSCLLIIRGLRDLIDDIGRHRSDRSINSRPCEILAGTRFCWRQWRDICVGDIVRLRKDSVVPGLIHSEPSSLCYVETADIDGETNLKFRQALLVTHQELQSEESMAAFDGRVRCEEPNSRLHSFTGTLRWRGRTHGLDGDRILLRGCRVRNTALCYGLVLYAGFDSKIMRNSGKIKRKKTKLDHLMDRLVIVIFLLLLLTSLGLAVASGFWARTFQEKHSYLAALYQHTSPAHQAFLNFWGFTILLSIIIPMSMYITFEFIYLVNSCFINWDLEMYYGAKDIPAEARSTSLSDQLGQIQYIFSDKTGTLTQNIMSFKKCCVNGTIYGNQAGILHKGGVFLCSSRAAADGPGLPLAMQGSRKLLLWQCRGQRLLCCARLRLDPGRNAWLLPWAQHLPMGCWNWISPAGTLSGHGQQRSPGGRVGCGRDKEKTAHEQQRTAPALTDGNRIHTPTNIFQTKIIVVFNEGMGLFLG